MVARSQQIVSLLNIRTANFDYNSGSNVEVLSVKHPKRRATKTKLSVTVNLIFVQMLYMGYNQHVLITNVVDSDLQLLCIEQVKHQNTNKSKTLRGGI